MKTIAVTGKVHIGEGYEGEIYLNKCVCGKILNKEGCWYGEYISSDPHHPWVCSSCGAKLYIKVTTTIYQLVEGAEDER